MSTALPVLLKPCRPLESLSPSGEQAEPHCAEDGAQAAATIMASSRRKNGSGSFVKPPRLAFCKSVFPEANRLPGAISPN